MTQQWWNGSRLKAARKRKGLTQAGLAERVGVGQVTIARMETGTRGPSVPMLLKLAKALRVPMEQLIAK